MAWIGRTTSERHKVRERPRGRRRQQAASGGWGDADPGWRGRGDPTRQFEDQGKTLPNRARYEAIGCERWAEPPARTTRSIHKKARQVRQRA